MKGFSAQKGAITSSVVAVIIMAGSIGIGRPSPAADWPSWRGPEQNGVSRERDLPDTWSPEDGGANLVWKQPYGSRSGPVVNVDRLYLTGVVGKGAKQQSRLLCLDPETGRGIWEKRFNVFLTDIAAARVGWANPAVDPETGFVYIHGVQGVLACFDHNGELQWQRSLTEEFGRISGYGGRTHTPVLFEDLVIISFLNSSWGEQGRGLHRYLALDKRSGSVVWWSGPGGKPLDTTYSCPIVTVIDGESVLLGGNADGAVWALRPRTGEPLWSFRLSKRGLNVSLVEHDGLVYAAHSEENVDNTEMGRVVCIDAHGARGDVTGSHEKWRVDALTCGYSSPVLDGETLYISDNSANLHAFDAKSGKERWSHDAGTVMKGSPVLADGKLWVGATNGEFRIVGLGPRGPRTLSEQKFVREDGRVLEINGSPCVSGGRVYFSTSEMTYCIGKPKWSGKSDPRPPSPAEAPPPPDARPARLQVVPGDVTLAPGQGAAFQARLFDEAGRLLGASKARWIVQGFGGRVDDRGHLVVAPSSSFQAGHVAAFAGELTAAARVRVVPPLPLRIDFEARPDGGSPLAGWIGATGVKFRVSEIGGNHVLEKLADKPKFMQANTYFGRSTWHGYTIGADVMGRERRRQMPNIGIINQRYYLTLMGNAQRLRIVSWVPMPRIEKKARFRWSPDKWYRMKLGVEDRGDAALVRGKVWPREEAEPADWTLEVEDPAANREGTAGLHGYSAGTTDRSAGPAIYFDNITVTRTK